jgi:copper ion binding protein
VWYVDGLPIPLPRITLQETPMATQLTFRVDGMSCDHCKAAVTAEVGKVAGVDAVDVDLETKLVRVAGADVDRDAVVEAIDEAGYDAEAT